MNIKDTVKQTGEVLVVKAEEVKNRTGEILRLEGAAIEPRIEGIDIYESIMDLVALAGLVLFIAARTFSLPNLDRFFYITIWGYYFPMFLLAAYEEHRGNGSVLELSGIVLGAFAFVSTQSSQNPEIMFTVLGISIVINLAYNLGGEAEGWIPRIRWLVGLPFRLIAGIVRFVGRILRTIFVDFIWGNIQKLLHPVKREKIHQGNEGYEEEQVSIHNIRHAATVPSVNGK